MEEKKKQKDMTKEEWKAYLKEWRLKNPDKVKAQRQRRKEKLKSLGIPQSIYSHEYYVEHKEQLRLAQAGWVERNIDKVKEYRRKKYQEYKIKPEYIEMQRKWREKRRAEKNKSK